MTLDEMIYAWLTGYANLTALVTNIYIGRVPNDAGFPILQLRQIGGTNIASFEQGVNALRNPVYQVDAYARTRTEAQQIIDVAAYALCNEPGAGFRAVAQDEAFSAYEEDANDNRLTQRLSFWYTDTVTQTLATGVP